MLDEHNHNDAQSDQEVREALFEYRLLHQSDIRPIEDLLKDYRAHPEQGDKHPFVVALYNLALQTSWAFARRKGFSVRGPELFEAVWMHLLTAAEKKAGGRLLAGHDTAQCSVASYLWRLEKRCWIDLACRQLDEEAEIRAGQQANLSKEQARKNIANEWKQHKEDPVNHARPQIGGRFQSLDDLEQEPAGGATPVHRLADDHWAEAAARGHVPVPPSVVPGAYQTPLQSPMRRLGLATAYEELGEAMRGLKSIGHHVIGDHEIRAWRAFWAASPGFAGYAQVSMTALAERLDYATRAIFLTVLGRAIHLWLNPPDDAPGDTPAQLAQKAQVRALAEHCLRLALPTKLIGRVSPEEVQQHIAHLRALLRGEVFAEVDGRQLQVLQQFRSQVQDDFRKILADD